MSNDQSIPSTGEVRADYVRGHTRNFDSYMVGRSLTSEQEFYGAKFDRWLAAHDAEVQAQVVAEEPSDDEQEALVKRLEDEVEYRVRTAVALHKGGHDHKEQVRQGRASVRFLAAGFRRTEAAPTDDEREDMIAFLLRDHNFEESPWGRTYTDAEIANALRRSEVPETAPELFPGTLDALDSLTIRKEEA